MFNGIDAWSLNVAAFGAVLMFIMSRAPKR